MLLSGHGVSATSLYGLCRSGIRDPPILGDRDFVTPPPARNLVPVNSQSLVRPSQVVLCVCVCVFCFFSPPVHVAQWPHMHRFLCLSFCLSLVQAFLSSARHCSIITDNGVL